MRRRTARSSHDPSEPRRGRVPSSLAMRRWAKPIALVASTLLAPACYRYVPAELAGLPDGQDVRMYLTRQGIAAIDELPLESGPLVRGRFVNQDNGDVILRIPVAVRQTGFHTSSIGQDVRIPTSEIIQVERRRFDSVGTGLLIGGSAIATALVMKLILDSRNDTTGEPPLIEELRVPLFLLRIR